MMLRWVPPTGDQIVFSKDATDYKWTKNYVGLSIIPVTHMTVTAPYQDGTTLINSHLDNRQIGFEVMIMAPDLITLQARVKALASSFKPNGLGYLYYTNEAGVEYRIACIGNNTPTLSTGDRSRNYQRAFIELIAFDPFWYSGSSHVIYLAPTIAAFFPFDISGNFLGWNSASTIAQNTGDSVTPVTITINGECIDPILTNEKTGEVITLDISMNAGDQFIITTGIGNKTATYIPSGGASENGFPYIVSTSVLWQLEPGDNMITLTDTSIAATAYVSIVWYDKFVAV